MKESNNLSDLDLSQLDVQTYDIKKRFSGDLSSTILCIPINKKLLDGIVDYQKKSEIPGTPHGELYDKFIRGNRTVFAIFFINELKSNYQSIFIDKPVFENVMLHTDTDILHLKEMSSSLQKHMKDGITCGYMHFENYSNIDPDTLNLSLEIQKLTVEVNSDVQDRYDAIFNFDQMGINHLVSSSKNHKNKSLVNRGIIQPLKENSHMLTIASFLITLCKLST